VTVEVSREELTERFRAFTDEELLRHLQSESLTPLATEVATAELRLRGIEPQFPGGAASGTDGETPQGAQADLITVSESWDPLQANVLRGRLESEGIAAYVWSDPVGTPDARGGRARVVVERYQAEQAKSVIAAIERGDLEIPDSPDTKISAGDPVRFARRTARGGAVPFAILTIRWLVGSFASIRAVMGAAGSSYAVTVTVTALIQVLVASALLALAWRTYRKPTVLLCAIATVLAAWDFLGAFVTHRLSGIHMVEVVSALAGLYAAWVVKSFQPSDRPSQGRTATS
jgi:hypothetical protein